ncbi:MAG: RtcB family protein, partial [Lysinibacillus sp.]
GEKLVIPLNMRDGSLICVGKGNPEWNNSAPHGAGRVFSRRVAKEQLNMTDFKQTMEGIWTTSVTEETLDEAPMAYKSADEITSMIGDTVDILKVIKPVYNFKASEEVVSYRRKSK